MAEDKEHVSTMEEEGGGRQKSVKISILKHLQSFRSSQQASSAQVKYPKVQKLKKEDQPVVQSSSRVVEVDEREGRSISSQMEEGEDEDQDESTHEESDTVKMDEEEDGGCSQEEEHQKRANVIRAIDRTVVHQICSGQVIVTLSTAVKELVENSIDAGATKIDIRLVEYGSKLIEVSDDACGIEEINFEGLALKHHTSKIAEFEDLESLSTFGFRGEALSSLCALSNLTVITRHRDNGQKTGWKIEYDNNGRITSKTRCAREFGTTIVMKDLFHTLPVRHREFMKNLKREFHRMVNVLYGYCLVVNGVRISCTNQVGTGGPTKVVGVPGYSSMKERIVAVFGSKQLTSLIEVKQSDEVPEEILSEFGLTEKTFERKYELEGYISQPNQGRSSNDRQFFFINSRPCDPAKISRVINEVYHSFSRSQNPFVCLHIRTNRENVDINVTPDKRTLYVQNEKILLATLKATLVPLFTAAASSYNPSSQSSQLNFTGLSSSQTEDNSISISRSFEIEPNNADKLELDETKGGFARQYSTSRGRTLPPSVIAKTNSFIQSFANKGNTRSSGVVGASKASDFTALYKRSRELGTFQDDNNSKQPKLSRHLTKFEATEKISIGVKNFRGHDEIDEVKGGELHSRNVEDDNHTKENSDAMDFKITEFDEKGKDSDIEVLYDDDSDVEEVNTNIQRRKHISVNWENISSKLAALKIRNETGSTTINYARRFRAKISPEDNTTAEEELKKQITKDMFIQMEILGQFNLGFIVVKNGPDLFIVDQHASDEKYNFEDLEKTMILQGQPLICPLDLQLPAISENIIIDNVEVFQKNGFDFIISSDDEPTKRVKLSKIPYSKNTEFGKSDVEELIFMMEDSSDKCFYRPTKVRQMFASRACRKSVMIGTALNLKEMRTIVDHMGGMDQPWNCPHGRPTIRHLINLNLLPDVDYSRFNH